MGCGAIEKNVVIEVAYCGGVGWSIPAKKVCEQIKRRIPRAVLDCRPEETVTGVLEVSLLKEHEPKQQVYRGSKEEVMAGVEEIGGKVASAYESLQLRLLYNNSQMQHGNAHPKKAHPAPQSTGKKDSAGKPSIKLAPNDEAWGGALPSSAILINQKVEQYLQQKGSNELEVKVMEPWLKQ